MQTIPITKVPFVIGRDPAADLCITSDPLISRRQCVIDWVNGAYVIRDANSTNGTRLDERPLGDQFTPLPFKSAISFSFTTVLTFVAIELPDLTGCVVGERYRLIELIRSSRKSAVYRGEHQYLRKPVAVKVLSPELAAYPAYLEQFNREAKTTALMEHPSIATILDCAVSTFEVEGYPEFQAPYICTNFMEGGDLATRIAENRFLKPADVNKWLVPIADAMNHAHDQGVFHGQLKTTSVVFDGKLKPYLKDFATTAKTDSSEPSMLLDWPDFRAPEIWDEQPPTHHTDQFSLAVLAYHSLAGVRPYVGQEDRDVRARNFRHGPIPVHVEAERCGNTGVSPATSKVLAHAMATNPKDRYPTAREFAEAFSRSLDLPYIFLSYERGPVGICVREFAKNLTGAGMEIFMDVDHQDTAELITEKIERAISKCDVFVCFLADTTLVSEWVSKEIRFAHRHKKRMISIRLDSFREPKRQEKAEGLGSATRRTRKKSGPLETLLDSPAVLLHDERGGPIEDGITRLMTLIKSPLRN